MSKAVLVIDMPESCAKCPLFNDVYSDMCCRGLNNRGINYPYPKDFRQDWCPLKPMPRMKFTYVDYDCSATIYYNNGWNDCINAILGDTT